MMEGDGDGLQMAALLSEAYLFPPDSSSDIDELDDQGQCGQ